MTEDVGLLQVSAWHDRAHTYIAGIPLLAHGLTVKLSPWPVYNVTIVVQLDEYLMHVSLCQWRSQDIAVARAQLAHYVCTNFRAKCRSL